MKIALLVIVALFNILLAGCATVMSEQTTTWHAGSRYNGTINTKGLIWKCSGGTCLLTGLYGKGLNMIICQQLSKKVGGLDYYYNDSGMTWSKTQNRPLLDQCNNNDQELSEQYDTPPQAIELKKPVYPESLGKSGNKGDAVIAFTVDLDGHVKNPKVIKATHPAFGEAAIDALLKSQFRPAQKQGKPIETTLTQPYKFNINSIKNGGVEAYDVSGDVDEKLPSEFQYDIPPQIKLSIAPIYPSNLLKNNINGEATVKFIVDASGHVSDSSIISASHPDFGKATKAMIDSYLFNPATKAGLPVSALLSKEQVFDTNGSEGFISPGTQQMLDNLKSNITIYHTKDLDNKPKILFQVNPIYPGNLRADRVTGKALIRYFIDADGRVQLPEIVTATNDDFAWAALTAVSHWRFESPLKEANKVIILTETLIRFELK